MSAPARHRAATRGMTLIEGMMATVVLLVGMLGLLSANIVSLQQNAYAVKQNQATALARDVLDTVARWHYADARLTNLDANDEQVLESGSVSSEPDWSAYELDLNEPVASLAGATDTGLPPALDTDGDGVANFKRHVALRPLSEGATRLGLLVSAVVSWREGNGWRQVVLHTMVYDPAGNHAPVPGL